MEAFTTGWRRVPVDGGFLLSAPDPKLGVIRVRTGIPLRPVAQVVAAMTANPVGGARFETLAPPRSFVTAEGEHAARFSLVVRPPGFEVRNTIIAILGDTEMVTLDARAAVPEGYDLGDKVEAMARAFSLGLGTDRWRRAGYQPPPGWHRIARFRADAWLPPDYPKNRATITVFFSRPVDPTTPAHQHARLFEHLGAEFAKGAPMERKKIELPSGLVGEFATLEGTVDGEVRRVTSVSVSHGGRAHVLRLDTGAEHALDNLATFRALVGSSEPVPVPKQSAAAFAPWTD